MDVRDAFFYGLYDLAQKDKNVILLTADMGALALEKFQCDFPDRFINVGIAEQNLIGVATGLSMMGKKVYVYGIASFVIYRCLDQIRCDLVEMNLPVTIIGAGVGLSYGSDGASHHALYDLLIMRQFPNVTILTPHNAEESQQAVKMSYESDHPVYVRLSKGELPMNYGSWRDYCTNAPFIVEGKKNNVLDG